MRDKYTFKEITYNETKDIILNYHYSQRMPSISYAFGCYEDNELIGVVTYGKPVSHWLCIGVCGKEHGKRVFEKSEFIYCRDELIKVYKVEKEIKNENICTTNKISRN